MVRNWLITGGCGFIGTSLIRKILEKDPKSHIRVLDNLEIGKRDDLKKVSIYKEIKFDEINSAPGVFLLVGDIREYDKCLQASKNVDCIVHLAANTGVGPSVENPRLDMEINVVGLFNMLEGARQNKVSQFVFASSGAPAGMVEPPIHEELAAHPVSPYGASKLAGEGYCSCYYLTYAISTVSLRFGNVFGPGSKNKYSVVSKFIRQALTDETCEIYGDGTQTRDFIYIDDLINAIIIASEFTGGEVFQIASGVEFTINELVEKLKVIFENETGKSMKVVNAKSRLGDVKRNYADTSKAKKVLGWEPKVSITDGLRYTVRNLNKELNKN